jgi:hypothetical protein
MLMKIAVSSSKAFEDLVCLMSPVVLGDAGGVAVPGFFFLPVGFPIRLQI